MAGKRQRFTPESKARVALEALRKRDSVRAIAARHGVHPTQDEPLEAAADRGNS